jgi:hypothetical protein
MPMWQAPHTIRVAVVHVQPDPVSPHAARTAQCGCRWWLIRAETLNRQYLCLHSEPYNRLWYYQVSLPMPRAKYSILDELGRPLCVVRLHVQGSYFPGSWKYFQEAIRDRMCPAWKSKAEKVALVQQWVGDEKNGWKPFQFHLNLYYNGEVVILKGQSLPDGRMPTDPSTFVKVSVVRFIHAQLTSQHCWMPFGAAEG